MAGDWGPEVYFSVSISLFLLNNVSIVSSPKSFFLFVVFKYLIYLREIENNFSGPHSGAENHSFIHSLSTPRYP